MAKKKKTENTNRLGIYVALDRSGSMVGEPWDVAIASINEYISEAKKEGTNGVYSVTAFDSLQGTKKIEIGSTWQSGQEVYLEDVGSGSIQEYVPLVRTNFGPRGGTPLYDAAAQVMNKALKDYEDGNVDKAIAIILTDGHENASKEYNQTSIKKLVEELQKKNLEVIFLGANFDVTTYTAQAGLSGGKMSMYNAQDKASVANIMSSLHATRSAYVTHGTAIDLTDPKHTQAAGTV